MNRVDESRMPGAHPDQRSDQAEALDERVLTRLLGDLPDAVVVVDRECSIIWANRAAERLFQRRLRDSMGISGLDLVHPDDLELVLRSLVSVQGKEIGTTIEVRVKTSDGWRLVEVLGSPVPWLRGGAIILCLRDATERRRFEVATGQEARLRMLVQNSAAVTLLVNRDGTVESVSGALTRLLGHDPELIEGKPLAHLVVPEDRATLEGALLRASFGASASNSVTIQVQLMRHSGGSMPFELAMVNLLDDPTVSGYVISAHDITARWDAEMRLRNALSLLTATLDSTADGILVVDLAGRITSFNRRFVAMWRIPDHLLSAGDDVSVIGFVDEQLTMPEAFRNKIEELYAQPEIESDDTLEFKDGRVFERHSKPQRVDGLVVGRVWNFRDVTDRKRLEKELTYQAFHDSLTGLANKALFQDRLQHAAARLERTKAHLAVLFLDLDNFKTVNDSLGHAAGDEMLRRVAEVVVGCLRKVDTAARLGGDEFAILIEDIQDRSDVRKLAERILGALRRPVSVGSQEMATTVSIGITFDSPGITSDQLLRNADLAMYTAKERGKNRYQEFESDMHTAVVARLDVQAHLHQALEDHELIVHYQPIVDLFTGSITGFEALARWKHPTRGLLGPISFIPFAEESDLITKIDSFVLAEACRQVRAWQVDSGTDLAINVNVSSRRLIDATLAEDVAAVLVDEDLSPSSLVLEVTESGVMRDAEIAAHNLRTLKAFGVRIALDDFGTGYSSLSYLEQLPIDILKIDKSFVSSLGEDPQKLGLAPAIIQLTKTLGYTPIAEGVENTSQVLHLQRLGCRLAQGYHLGVPQDAASAALVLSSRASSGALEVGAGL